MKIKQIAKEAEKIGNRIGLNLDAVLHKLTQEAGEFNDAVQKYRGIFCKKRTENLDDVKDEYGDALFNLIYSAHLLGIDVNKTQEYVENTLNKFREREKLYKQNMDKNKLPTISGVYLVKGTRKGSTEEEIEVYNHPPKGLCFYSEDAGSSPTGVNDEMNCNVPIQCLDMKFIKRLRDLD